MDWRKQLDRKLGMDDIHELCFLTQGADNDRRKEELYEWISDADTRIASNALWVFTHFALADNRWLYAKHDDLIDRVLAETNTTKRRLLLVLLYRQPFGPTRFRTDFLDFCLRKMTSCTESYGVRALCMKLAYEQCRNYPELMEELKSGLELLADEPLSPGLLSARRQVWKQITTNQQKNERT